MMLQYSTLATMHETPPQKKEEKKGEFYSSTTWVKEDLGLMAMHGCLHTNLSFRTRPSMLNIV